MNVRVFERDAESLTPVTGIIKLRPDACDLNCAEMRDWLFSQLGSSVPGLRKARHLHLHRTHREQLKADLLDKSALASRLRADDELTAEKHFIAAVFRKAMIGLAARKYRHRLTSCAAEAAAPAMRGGSYWPCCVHCLETLFGARWNECLCSSLLFHARPYFRLT